MVRKWVIWSECSALLALQLGLIGFFIASLASSALGQAAPSSATSPPLRLGAFLNQYPITKSELKLMAKDDRANSWKGDLVGVRIFKDKSAALTVYRARESFTAECTALGGRRGGKAHRF
jgi:hypothetical protein